MVTTYDFDKSPVNIERLDLEIDADESITTALVGSYFNEGEEPNNLHITFQSDLDAGEQTALGTLVTNHSGNPPTSYEPFCYDCGKYRPTQALSTPTQCPVCDSTDIQPQYHKSNFIATRDPTVDDDITQGFCSGSGWINIDSTPKKAFKCLDPAEGAAEWEEITHRKVRIIHVVTGSAPYALSGGTSSFLKDGQAGGITGTEDNCKRQLTPCTVVAICGRCSAHASNGTLTVYKNGEATDIDVTVSATGKFRGTGSEVFAANDEVSVGYSVVAGDGLSVGGVTLELDVPLT